eukprot:9279155-Ditylum_brightwellii.AAC.1
MSNRNTYKPLRSRTEEESQDSGCNTVNTTLTDLTIQEPGENEASTIENVAERTNAMSIHNINTNDNDMIQLSGSSTNQVPLSPSIEEHKMEENPSTKKKNNTLEIPLTMMNLQ